MNNIGKQAIPTVALACGLAVPCSPAVMGHTGVGPSCVAPADLERSGRQRLGDAALALQGMPKPDKDAQNATYQMLLRMGFDVETARAGAVKPQVLQAALNGRIRKRCAARN
jgi:hypothetical protein